MTSLNFALADLTKHFKKLPGIGEKTAQRLAYYVVSMQRAEVEEFSSALIYAKEHIHTCPTCFNVTDMEVCDICSDDRRDRSVICVVEQSQDVLSFEKIRDYKGLYHVLQGVISPIDGIGPDQLRIRELIARCGTDEVKEVILATNPTIEGEATAMYINRMLKAIGVRTTRIAYGIPVGGDLKFADEFTLLRAYEGRRSID